MTYPYYRWPPSTIYATRQWGYFVREWRNGEGNDLCNNNNNNNNNNSNSNNNNRRAETCQQPNPSSYSKALVLALALPLALPLALALALVPCPPRGISPARWTWSAWRASCAKPWSSQVPQGIAAHHNTLSYRSSQHTLSSYPLTTT